MGWKDQTKGLADPQSRNRVDPQRKRERVVTFAESRGGKELERIRSETTKYGDAISFPYIIMVA